MPHAAFYVVQPDASPTIPRPRPVSMPHAAFYVVQRRESFRSLQASQFQCRTQHFMWCNLSERQAKADALRFNAARSILCGATENRIRALNAIYVSMPHAAFYVVQRIMMYDNGYKSLFQCRTQHFMWCNLMSGAVCVYQLGFNAARSILCGATLFG